MTEFVGITLAAMLIGGVGSLYWFNQYVPEALAKMLSWGAWKSGEDFRSAVAKAAAPVEQALDDARPRSN